MHSPHSSRAPSTSSERSASTSSAALLPITVVKPPPAYIAVAAASQIVTDHHNAQLLDDLDGDDSDHVLQVARFSVEALGLLNTFLDSLLYSILATARSPSIYAIRPAVQEVLRPRLAREAMGAADEELSGLLSGGDEEEEFPNGQEEWNLERIWKRTRLRIMVYTRLGELEDDDEEHFLSEDDEEPVSSYDVGLVSWASAIFLTSVIEYIAEQTLIAAGQAAFSRVSNKRTHPTRAASRFEDEEAEERVIVQDFDVEKVALNAALGRIWRTWKKSLRGGSITPLGTTPIRHSISRPGGTFSMPVRRYSTGNAQEAPSVTTLDDVPEVEHTEWDIAANIPLPMNAGDIAEIEVPGLARDPDEIGSGLQTPTPRIAQRPASYIMLSPTRKDAPRLTLTRSRSMPSLKAAVPQEPVPGTTAETTAEKTEEKTTETAGTAAEAAAVAESVAAETATEAFLTPPESARVSYTQPELMLPVVGASKRDSRAEAAAATVALAATAAAAAAAGDDSSVADASIMSTLDERPESFYSDQAASETKETVSASPQGAHVRSIPAVPELARESSVLNEAHDELPRSERFSTVSQDREDSHGQHIGVARTSNEPIPSPIPPEIAADLAAVKEKRAFRRSSASPPVSRSRPTTSSEKLAGLPAAMMASESASSRPSSTSSKPVTLQPVAERREVEDPSKRASKIRSLTVSTVASQTVPTSPQSASSTHTRDSSRRSNDSARSSGRTRLQTLDPFAQERAAVQRVNSISSTSTSILHTSRGSESSIAYKGINERMSDEDRAREFDSQVAAADTVYYTLTPEKMRDGSVVSMSEGARPLPKPHHASKPSSPTIDSPKPVVVPKPVTQVTVHPRVASPVVAPQAFGGSQTVSPRTSVSSPASKNNFAGHSFFDNDDISAKGDRKTPRPSRINATNGYYRSKLMPKEPRVQTDPTFDLRDFLLSTTPAAGGLQNHLPIETSLSKSPSSASSRLASNFSPKSSVSGPPRSAIGGTPTSPSTKDHLGLRVHKNSLEPRSPAGLSHLDTDLIDLIRQGPPGGPDSRISRSVAPFRDTMDSEQLDMFSSAVPSVTSEHTINSRSGLLPNPPASQPTYGTDLAGSLGASEPTIVKNRPKKRIDPYAIPSDDEDEEDEEDDLLTALPGGSRGPSRPTGGRDAGNLSMADFLNSEPPPSLNTAPPVQPFMLSESTLAAMNARSNSISKPSSAHSSIRSAGTPVGFQAPAITTTSISGPSSSGSIKKPVRRPNGARDARTDEREERAGLNEMADFLKNSGPPPSASAPVQQFVKIGKEETKGRTSLKFWRR